MSTLPSQRSNFSREQNDTFASYENSASSIGENITVPSFLNDTVEFPSFPAYMQAVYSCCCAITFLVGVIGNLLVPVVVYKDRELTNSSTGAFIVNLALADLLVLLVCNPAVIVELFSPPQIWVLPAPMCKLVPFIELIVENASVLTILAISLERHHVICHPLRAATACTKTRAALICTMVWPVAAAVSSPVIVWTELTMANYVRPQTVVPVCLTRVDHLWPSIYMLSLNVGFFFLPLLVLIVLYWRIVRQLLLDDKYLCPHKPNSNFQARKQVVVMLGTVVTSFFVCLMPYHVFSLWHFIASDIYIMSSDWYFNIIFFSRTMIYVNSAVNPVLYNLTSSRFRDSLSRLLGFRRKQMSISRTSSFHPGMTLQMGVAIPMVSAASQHLERSSTMPWYMAKNRSSSNNFHSLRVSKSLKPIRDVTSASANSSPYFQHRANSSLTLATHLSSPCSDRSPYTHTSCSTRKNFLGKGFTSSNAASSQNPFRSIGSKKSLSSNGKSPFLGRSATMLMSPSHLSDRSPYLYRGGRKNTCDVPTCCRSSANSNEGDQVPNIYISSKEQNFHESESYV